MNFSAKGRKQFVSVGSSSRCFNVGNRQQVTPINMATISNNVKSDIVRVNNSVVKRVRGDYCV